MRKQDVLQELEVLSELGSISSLDAISAVNEGLFDRLFDEDDGSMSVSEFTDLIRELTEIQDEVL